MKHDLSIVAWIIVLFIVSQLLGLFLLAVDIQEISKDPETGKVDIVYEETAIGPRPEVKGAQSFLYLALGITFGTILLLILVHFKRILTWKIWFFLATTLALTIAFGVFLNNLIALILSMILASWKIFRPHILVHNFTEVFMYAGIALFLVPLFDMFWAVLLLVAISLYDMYAVWKSKHMVKMAKFLGKSKSFAGLFIPYTPVSSKKKQGKGRLKKVQTKHAVLGGGDLVFPLIFGGVALNTLIESGFIKSSAFFLSLLIPLFATVALVLLFAKSKKNTFYPAMPFLSIGCFIGGIAVFVVQSLL